MHLAAIDFPLLNATLNLIATVLLMTGYVAIRSGREIAHKRIMLSAFGVSVLFLISYVYYHYKVGHVRFGGPPPLSYFYYLILITHIILAMVVPVLAIVTLYLGLTDRRQSHRRVARWTLPIWLYVSVTGVIIYILVYVIFTPLPARS